MPAFQVLALHVLGVRTNDSFVVTGSVLCTHVANISLCDVKSVDHIDNMFFNIYIFVS